MTFLAVLRPRSRAELLARGLQVLLLVLIGYGAVVGSWGLVVNGLLAVPVVLVPDWFGTLQLAFVLIGHLIAIWVAHGVAFETFTGRLQPIRSQYPYSLVMILYTMVSIGIVYQPSIAPPYL